MILSPGPIDVAPVLSALRMFAELGYIDTPSAGAALGPGHAAELLDEGPRVFTEYVADNADREDEVRRGLCWLLNQPDDVLGEILAKARMPFPSGAVTERRRYLETLWDAAFAAWQVEGLDPDDYQVSGLPS